MLEESLKKVFVIQNKIPSIVVGEQPQQGLMIRAFLVEGPGDEFEILGGELDAAIGLNQLHITISESRFSDELRAQFVPKGLRVRKRKTELLPQPGGEAFCSCCPRLNIRLRYLSATVRAA